MEQWLDRIVNGFIKNLEHKGWIKSISDADVIYRPDDSVKIDEIRISLNDISINDAKFAIELTHKYPLFEKVISNMFVDNDKKMLRILFDSDK